MSAPTHVNAGVLALAGLLTACSSVAPGLQFKQRQLEARGTAEQPIAIVQITSKVLLDEAEARSKAATARPKDPLAEQAASWQYRIAPYDVLSVIVWDHPELTIPAGEFRAAETFGNAVQADGTMFYPHVGVIEVAGKTLPEVRTLIADRLRRVIENPQLDVRIAAFRGQRIEVTGEVMRPSTLPITDVPLRVQDAIGAAEGLTPNAWTRGVVLTRAGRTYRLDLQAFYDEGDRSQNWLLQDGDVVHVPSREENKVFVLGEVQRPSSKVMARGRMSLAEAIGDSEGFDPTTSNPSDIFVFRGRYETPRVYRLDASSADAMLLATHFQLEPQDVVYVAPYGLTNWNRIITQVLPTLQTLWYGVDAFDRSRDVVIGN
ncbi:polysaccharide export protein [Anaeromyxobacter sp. Fw109-5]|uniref:polysaccharide export protein n=1 Tax=Anaeromyxobacter sp. (strain Fw109-5) TaxID=404589 RepID=UPI000158A8A9|nr:polysaccharide export protein [Anaeromyxobacter sp. Fw109-5]ABS28607.1 polysaccharide export protein [Anaeromyxobacter sp. Fw109-5]